MRRDAEYHALTREMAKLRVAPVMRAYAEVLGANPSETQRGMLNVMLSFYTWRTLVRESGFTQSAAVQAAVEAIAPSNPD